MGSGASSNTAVESHSSNQQGHSPLMQQQIHQQQQLFQQRQLQEWHQYYQQQQLLQSHAFGYPPPQPPPTRKSQIYRPEDHKRNNFMTPLDVLYQSYESLAHCIVVGLQTDLERVRALFRWLTSLDFEVLVGSMYKLPDAGSPADQLLKIHWKIGDHATFFTHLARAAGIPCWGIAGINKSSAYQLGAAINRSQMSAQWNAVYVAGGWRLIDVFWASNVLVGKKSRQWAQIDDHGYETGEGQDQEGKTVHTSNEYFFLTDPDELIYTHFPDNPEWQLLSAPITHDRFETLVYIRERFFQLTMYMLPDSPTVCHLNAHNGQTVIKFGVYPAQALHLRCQHILYRQLSDGENTKTVPYERFVFFERSENSISYTIKFPVVGRFKLDIFGQNTLAHESLQLVCSYLVDCAEVPQKVEPLPLSPSIGWGPGPELQSVGLQPITHKDAVITTHDGHVEIRFAMTDPVAVLQSLRHNVLTDWLLRRFAIVRTEGGQLVLNLRLPSAGEFALELFADKEGGRNELRNVCNYLIKCVNEHAAPPAFPQVPRGTLGRSVFADMFGVFPVSHLASIISTLTDKPQVVFEANSEDVELFCELHCNNIDPQFLSGCVTKMKNGKQTTFSLTLPNPGEYALNIYARSNDDANRIYHVHSHIINSQQETRVPAPGRKPEDDKAQRSPNSIETTKDEVNITVERSEGKVFGELTEKDTLNQNKTSKITAEDQTSDSKTLKVVLSREGQYTLEVFDEKKGGALEKLSTYQLSRKKGDTELDNAKNKDDTRKKQQANSSDDPLKEDAANKLRSAIKSGDIQRLEKALKDFKACGGSESNDDFKKATQLLKKRKVEQELTSAMKRRNLNQLKTAVENVHKAGLQQELGLQLQMANAIMERLKAIERMRHAIRDLDQAVVAEIKSYSTPPPIVHRVMMATFVLLGEAEKSLSDWKAVVILVGKTGQLNLKRRILAVDIENLSPMNVDRAREILGNLKAEEVQDVSNGVATFYVWCRGITEEYSEVKGNLNDTIRK